ncbi:MAG: hypothetical protein OSA44_02305 [Nitrospinaceae bacterium]|nr:hypothetical protein [Nitrospinaceae bacterium]
MKTKLTTRFSKLIAVLAFLALLAGNAFAFDNGSRVVSPYWQSDSTSYTFIAVSHTSLSGMASQIGLTINAITSDQSAFGTAVSFTVQSGTTTRVFIVRTNQSTINSTSISAAQFIVGTTNYKHGHIRVDPVATNPNARVGSTNEATDVGTQSLTGDGYRDITMLSFWGSVVVETNTTGFAMEFIGDMADSQATSVLIATGTNITDVQVVGPAAP